MPQQLSERIVTLVVASAVLIGAPVLQAQEPTFLTPVEMEHQYLRGTAATEKYGNDGSIGMNANGTDYKVGFIVPDGPAARVGVMVGDVIVSVDGVLAKSLNPSELRNLVRRKRAGDTVALAFSRNGETRTASVPVESTKKVWERDADWIQDTKLPPAVGQVLFRGSATVLTNLAQMPQYQSCVFLDVHVTNKDADALVADDAKFFVLDGTGQQLRHVSLDEIKYNVQLSVEQNWRGGNSPPPPPPPPQRQYTISGVENGNYTITNLGGGMGSISGTSNGTYTVMQQPDFGQLGYSLGLAIRQHRDAKADKKLLERAKQVIASWESIYFRSQSPVVSGEQREGRIAYWTGSDRKPEPPFRVILFFSDPRSQKEEHATFAFGAGAERISESLAKSASASQPAASSLSNRDVVEMVKAGLGAEIIVAKIKATSCVFDTSPSSLTELKQAGVPESVILA